MTDTSPKAATARFSLGRVFMTPGTIKLFQGLNFLPLLRRHQAGDWGEVCPEDAAENELSIREGFRVMSVYTVNGEKVWVITEADRSVTTLLLPDEY